MSVDGPGTQGDEAARARRRTAVRLVLAWFVILGAVIAVGLALTGPLDDSVGTAEDDFERSVVAHRTAALTGVAQAVSLLGETRVAVILVPILLVVAWLWLRLVRAVAFLAAAAIGAITAYLLAVNIVDRPRPPVRLLDPGLDPMHSYPSGHVAAAMATYGGLAALIWVHGGRSGRRLSVALAVLPPAVALARLYLGVHHPSDVLASLVYMSAWLAVAAGALLERSPRGTHPAAGHPADRAD